jgi:hypothetical protein
MIMKKSWERLFTLCVGFILSFGYQASKLSAQNAASGYVQPALVKTLQMSPPNQSLSFPFWVDQTTSISVTVSSLAKDLMIQLVDPRGIVFVLGQPSGNQFQSGLYPDPQTNPTVPGAHYFMDVESPSIGQWTLTIASPNSPAFTYFIPIRVNFNNSVGPVLFGGGGSFLLGKAVPFGLAVLDGSTKVSNLQITATLFMLDDPTVNTVDIGFFDDGMGADATVGDYIYGALAHPARAGSYMLQVEVSGDASTGHFQRSIASGFKIVPRTARIVGTFKERAIPAMPR